MNLDTTITIDVKGFFQWWGRELAFLVPKVLRHRFRDHFGRLIFISSPQGFAVSFLDDDATLIDQQSLELTGNRNFQSLKAQHPNLEKAEIVLRLAHDQALHKLVYLPGAALENLQQVVGFELDRYTPFKAEQVYFTALMLGKTDQGQLKVLLIVVPKANLDQQLVSLEKLGVQPHKIEYAPLLDEFPVSDQAYNLLPERYRQRGDSLSQSLYWLLGCLSVVLILAALVWPVWMQGQAVDELKARLQQLEKQTRIVDNQQTEIDALRAETQKLIDNKYQAPSLLAALNELSVLLKEDTWLTHLQFTDKRMQIQGQSPAASALIGVLEGSEYFSNVSFVSPLTQDKTTGRERFQISMDVSTPVAPADKEEDDVNAEDTEESPDASADEVDASNDEEVSSE